MNIRKQIEKLAEEDYKKFSKNLIPGCDNILGVRIPKLRALAKEIAKSDDYVDFLNIEEVYFEEIMTKGFVIGYLKIDVSKRLELIDKFILKINNWSVCDSFSATLKEAKKYQKEYFDFLYDFIGKSEFEQRFVAVMLMDHFINDKYVDDVLNIYQKLNNDGYYLKMAVAWGIATVAAKYPQKAYEFIDNNRTDSKTINLAIKKMRESYRISDSDKQMLKSKIRKD